jgi:integral membrane sensor domain MASE1
VSSLILIVAVAMAYLALGMLSSALAYSPADAWTVWLASGLTLGMLLVVSRGRWAAVLGGAGLGAAVFALGIGSGVLDALGYAAIEVVGGAAGAGVALRVADGVLQFDRPREVGAFVAGALAQAVAGAALAAAWGLASGERAALRTFDVWLTATFVGAILVAPIVVTWAGFRPKRSGGLTVPEFAAGATACALFLGSLLLLFGADARARFGGSFGVALTYVPVLFMSVVALTWGARGASLTAFAGALIALFDTLRESGPFAAVDEFVGEAEIEVQIFVAAVALTGLLIAALAARERAALREARAWRTRFEGAIGAHRMIAYEWDPVGGGFTVTGDTAVLLGVPPAQIAKLTDWLARISPAERDDVTTAFGLRGEGDIAPVLSYRALRPDGTPVALVDEAQAVRDHEGTLYRITGIVRAA